ncbi:transporter substrate-binding domain-containing protein [Campylobacter geochelonis]|uniref:transporter substrate-binding domain-containing protein n=1 Tax=Campylobacter geochelonis TaxID=1780362 RepID=UPI000770900E|nr:transporter substrate-binding domain-containing protein [Campylobacter geochelonis]CZE46664.1 amino acid [Campylobacter geochelonis]CZE50365.1 amino acid [Campylobacter geochelonis]
MRYILVIALLLSTFLFGRTLDEIKHSGVIRIGVHNKQPPFSLQNTNGEFEGFEIDLAKAMTKAIFPKEDVKFELVGVTLAQRIEFLENDKIDLVIASMTETEDRKKLVDFSIPYFRVNLGILTKKEKHITKLRELQEEGSTIIVEANSPAEYYFKQKGFKTIPCVGALTCYNMLIEDKGDAFSTDSLIVLAYPVINDSVEVVLKNLGETDYIGMAVSKGNEDLLEMVNGAIYKLSNDKFFTNAFNHTFVPFYKGNVAKQYFLLEDFYKILYDMQLENL